MTKFELSRYAPGVAELLQLESAPALGPGTANRRVEDRLRSLSDADLFSSRKIVDPNMARACRAGLWLLHDFLDESHSISQEIETTTGSYWHGIMHRREPDYENAKYWFRRVGRHPVFEPLQAMIRDDSEKCFSIPKVNSLRSKSAWDPYSFVDLCEQAASANNELEVACRAISLLEWQLLFDYSYQLAIGRET